MSDAEDESARTVLVAGAANRLIAVAKLVAGVASGSSTMLAEGARSVGDTINQAFLRARRPGPWWHWRWPSSWRESRS